METNSGAHININGKSLPLRVFIFCLVCEILFLLLDAFINYEEWAGHEDIRAIFNTTHEIGLSSWFMVTQTFVASAVLWVVFLVQKGRNIGRMRIIQWGLLAAFFSYLCIDDGIMLHEALGSVFYDSYSRNAHTHPDSIFVQIESFFPSYSWQLAVLPMLVIAGSLMLVFLWREFHTRSERLLMFLAASFMGFAVLLDFFEGLSQRHPWNMRVWFAGKFDIHLHAAAHYSKSIEETLEMIAISILLMLFLKHLIRISGPSLTFGCTKNKY